MITRDLEKKPDSLRRIDAFRGSKFTAEKTISQKLTRGEKMRGGGTRDQHSLPSSFIAELRHERSINKQNAKENEMSGT